MPRRQVTILNELGLHARAATRLVECANRFDCKVWLNNEDRKVDGKSIMGLLMLAAGPGMRIEITQLRDGLPRQLVLHFERPIDDPSMLFLAATTRGLAQVSLPEVGETLVLKRAVGPSWIGAERGRYEREMGSLPDFLDHDPVPDFVAFEPLAHSR